MKTTSHFVWIELKSELFSDIFSAVYLYLEKNNILDCIVLQNPLSSHITLYYFENNIDETEKEEIKKYYKKFDIKNSITVSGFDYFMNWEWKKFICYFLPQTDIILENYRNDLHQKFDRIWVLDNNYEFIPHITFFRIKNHTIFEKHKKNIENIINNELQKIKNININSWKIFLYAVNSHFKEEIQIKL